MSGFSINLSFIAIVKIIEFHVCKYLNECILRNNCCKTNTVEIIKRQPEFLNECVKRIHVIFSNVKLSIDYTQEYMFSLFCIV